MSDAGVRAAFLAALPLETRARHERWSGLDGALDEALSAATERWPGLSVTAAEVARYLGERVSEGDEPAEALRRLRVGDLYLACGCAAGDERAIAALDRGPLAEVVAPLRKMALADDVIDEVLQILRHRLLVADGGPPAIVKYAGRGALASWLRMVAIREALGIVKASARLPAAEVELEALPARQVGVEMAHLKKLYGAELGEALREAVGELGERERRLLRLHLVDGMGAVQLGEVFGVHRTSAARWLRQAREALIAGTKRCLRRRLEVDRWELESILRVVVSRLDVSVRGLLAD